MDTIPPHPPDVLLEPSDADHSLDFDDFVANDLLEAKSLVINNSTSSINPSNLSNSFSMIHSFPQQFLTPISQESLTPSEINVPFNQDSLRTDAVNILLNQMPSQPVNTSTISDQFKPVVSSGEERTYVCPQCAKTYKYKWDLNRHFERKHMSANSLARESDGVDFDASQFINNFQCNVCSKNFLDKSAFELHCQQTNCGKLLNQVSDGDQSSDEDENGQPAIFTCSDCPQSFDSRLLFKQHKLLHIRMYSCSKCQDKFIEPESFRDHVCLDSTQSISRNSPQNLTRISPLNVPVNGTRFDPSNPIELRREPSRTEVCKKDPEPQPTFRTSPSVNMANEALVRKDEAASPTESTASNSQPLPDPCEICGKRFATLSNLKRHMMSHSKIRNFKCPYCHKSYIYKWDLTNHIKKAHKGMSIDEVKPLYSTRDFYSEARKRKNPARNSATHLQSTSTSNNSGSNKAPSQGNMTCKHCGGVFLGQNSLHAHMILRHSGVIDDANDITNELMHFVEQYTCSFCGKAFSDKNVYRNHLASHSACMNNGSHEFQGGTSSNPNLISSSPEIYCNGCKAELMTEGIDLPSDEDVEYLCDVCDNERRRQEEAAGLA